MEQGGVVGHDAVATKLNKLKHLLLVVDGPILYRNTAAVSLSYIGLLCQIQRNALYLVGGGYLQAGEISVVDEVYAKELGKYEPSRASGGGASVKVWVIRGKLQLYLVVEGAYYDVVALVGIFIQSFGEYPAGLNSSFALVLYLHDEEKVAVLVIQNVSLWSLAQSLMRSLGLWLLHLLQAVCNSICRMRNFVYP